MTSSLRLGFLASGMLHVAVVAAFSLQTQAEIPAVDEPRPLTLQLAMFEPAGTVEAQRVPVEPEPPPPVVEPEPPTPVMEPEPVEPPPPPVIEQVRPQRAPAKPRKVEKRRVLKQPKSKPPRPEPVRPREPSPKPTEPSPAPNPTVKLVAAKPRPAAPAFAQERQHYLAALAANINRKKYYPLGSRRRGEEGTVVVSFVVQRNGELTDLAVVESSGSRRLDAAALKTLQRVTPFRPIPDTLQRDRWPITVPIAFRLKG